LLRLNKIMNKKNILILIICVLLGILFFVWQKGIFKSKAVLNTENPILGNASLDKVVTDFLLSKQEFSWKTGEGSTNFCVFENLNPKSELFPIYIWIRCGEFKVISGELKELSGTSLPLKIDYPNELSYYDLSKITFEAPRDGSLYDKDIKVIFPESIWPRLNHDGTYLNQKILEVAKKSLLK